MAGQPQPNALHPRETVRTAVTLAEGVTGPKVSARFTLLPRWKRAGLFHNLLWSISLPAHRRRGTKVALPQQRNDSGAAAPSGRVGARL